MPGMKRPAAATLSGHSSGQPEAVASDSVRARYYAMQAAAKAAAELTPRRFDERVVRTLPDDDLVVVPAVANDGPVANDDSPVSPVLELALDELRRRRRTQ